MSLKSKIAFEPVRSLSALLAFGAAVITAAAYNQNWTGEAVGLISGVWSAFIALIGTFFVRNNVTPNAALDEVVHNAILNLAEAFPQKQDAEPESV